MSLVRLTALAACAATAIVGFGTAAPAVAAEAQDTTAPAIGSARLSDRNLVIPETDFDYFTVSAKITDAVGVTEALGAILLDGELYVDGDGPAVFPLEMTSGTAQNGVWEQRLGWGAADPSGNFTVEIVALDDAENVNEQPASAGTFSAKFQTRIAGFNVGPEPVRKNAKVTVEGALERVTAAGWDGHANRTVKVQFRKSGTSSWVTKGTLKSNSDGEFRSSSKFTASAAGSWRVVFEGGSTTAPATSSTDNVELKK